MLDQNLPEIEQALKQSLSYDPKTGVITRTVGVTAGKQIGKNNKTGYIRVMVVVNNKKYTMLGHRVAWLLYHGAWPQHNIDHINGIKTDNRIENLRDVETRVNTQNQQKHRDGGLCGCVAVKGGWQVKIRFGKQRYYLGLYTTEQEAHEVYKEAESKGEEFAIILNNKFKHQLPKGIYYQKKINRYVVQKVVNGKNKHVACCKTLEEAIEINNSIRLDKDVESVI